jgi:hypothetical protein
MDGVDVQMLRKSFTEQRRGSRRSTVELDHLGCCWTLSRR